MQIDIFLVQNNLNSIISELTKKFGVPEVRRDLAIYYKNASGKEVHFRFRNKMCLALYIDSETDEIFRPKFHVDMDRTDIKSILLFFKKIGFNKASIGEATCFSFYNKNGIFLEILIDTFIGNFVQLGYENSDKIEQILKLLNKINLKPLKKNQLDTLLKNAPVKYQEVVDGLNVLNPKVYHFTKDIGLMIEKQEDTLKARLSNFNNNYSYLERAFQLVFSDNLLGKTSVRTNFIKYFLPVSIVIPSYNSEVSILKTLTSINSQNLSDEIMKEVEVIVIDDGSLIPVKSVIEKSKIKFRFRLKTIRLDSNSGLSNARNAGLSLVKNEIVIFIDSDIVLSNNYLLDHSIRNNLIPNALFVSFKQNLDPLDTRLSFESISKGLRASDISNDIRVRKVIPDNTPGLYEVSGKVAVEILGATDYFKDLSYGRSFGIYDLPSMVIGHNMSCRKENISKIGGFSNKFKGWGMEDSYFGARMISDGNFIIPVLSSGVYHIDHPPRSGSLELKRDELEANLAIYKSLLDSLTKV